MTEHRAPTTGDEIEVTDVELSVPVGVPVEDFGRLLQQGRAQRSLSHDDVMSVLRHVELTPDIIDTVRHRLAAEGIELDESVVLADPVELLQTLPPEPVVEPRRGAASGPARDPALDIDGRRFGRGAGSPVPARGSSDPVRTYLKEIGKVDLLDGSQEVGLARRIEAGQEAATRLAAQELLEGLARRRPTTDLRTLRRLRRTGSRPRRN